MMSSCESTSPVGGTRGGATLPPWLPSSVVAVEEEEEALGSLKAGEDEAEVEEEEAVAAARWCGECR